MDFESYLKDTVQQIDQELEKILVNFLEETKKTNSKLVPFALGLVNSCKGGKRIRGALIKLGYEIAASPTAPRNDILQVGAVYEMLHTAFLIHDDIMDQSLTRRGKPSLYKTLGVSQAINIGDIGLYLPIKIISDSNFSPEAKLKVVSLLSQTVINTGWGQVMDIEKGDREFVNLYKTAKYTIAAPLQVGAILGGGDEGLSGKLGKFGESLGIAFQIKDDILDGEEEADSKAKAQEYVNAAKQIIPEITTDDKISRLLSSMCEYVVERRK